MVLGSHVNASGGTAIVPLGPAVVVSNTERTGMKAPVRGCVDRPWSMNVCPMTAS